MRIVIDMQGAQSTGSRGRGIGRYAMSLAQAMIRNCGDHEILIALSGLFPQTINPIRSAFDGLLPQTNIRVWSAAAPAASMNRVNDWRRQSAELVREAFLASLEPDVVHVSSLFEGFGDDAVTSIGTLSRTIPTAVTLYDLIPYIYRKPYLENSAVEAWYLGKIGHLRRADLWLAISESSQREGIDYLGFADDRAVNISSDADTHFRRLKISGDTERALRQKYGLQRPFVMYTGGIDHRKNIEGLIRAFANLPTRLREGHQLAIVCHVQPESRHTLEELSAQQGLSTEDVVLTGFISDDDLLALYNLCALFIFPSWHEGFGLPALEAMRCGAPVIGANTSSLPEVIGWGEALFDPHSNEAMVAAIERALSDTTFRAELIRNGIKQSAKFSWDESAKRALAAMEKLHEERLATSAVNAALTRRPRLAYVSPLPPEKSGIADYSAELLYELANLYEIDVIVAQATISDPWIRANCSIRSVEWFEANSHRFERVLYHFGNSSFHQHMFKLLTAVPGVVVLHDFFLSGIAAHMDINGFALGYWAQELYKSHGYPALYDRFHARDPEYSIWKYPCSLSVIQDSLGIIAHSANSVRLAEQWYGSKPTEWAVIPLMRESRITAEREVSRETLGFSASDFVVCAFGLLGPPKLNNRLIQGWLKSALALDKSCHLVFVGENHAGPYGKELLATIRSNPNASIRITGWTDISTFRHYLAAADLGVQLRTLSRGETSAAVLDCMNYGLATIVNSNGSMADLNEEAVWKLPEEFTDEQLIEALDTLRQDEMRRNFMGKAGREIILRDHNPRICAEQYGAAIEKFYRSATFGIATLPCAIAQIDHPYEEKDLRGLATGISESFPPRSRKRQLLVDISELFLPDENTDIRRMVRRILKEWLHHPPLGYRVEPVYAKVDQEYRYARRLTLKGLGCPEDVLQDDVIDYALGDVFFGFDLQPQVGAAHRAFYQNLRRQGVHVEFMVHDLLSISMPQNFPEGTVDIFNQWLEVVAENDGALCMSKAVSVELDEWISKNAPARLRPFKVDWFRQGVDGDNSSLIEVSPTNVNIVPDCLRRRKSFLMIGVLEPKKAHAQCLEAFDQLWKSGFDINLVIVGKQGWLVEKLADRLRTHPELNKRLFWLEDTNDEYVEEISKTSTCLLSASFGEGFNLPLTEASHHNLPIITRDIPVFREVAEKHAFYFSGPRPEDLAEAIQDWLLLHASDQHPKSEEIPRLTWKESATQLLQKIIAPCSQELTN